MQHSCCARATPRTCSRTSILPPHRLGPTDIVQLGDFDGKPMAKAHDGFVAGYAAEFSITQLRNSSRQPRLNCFRRGFEGTVGLSRCGSKIVHDGPPLIF